MYSYNRVGEGQQDIDQGEIDKILQDVRSGGQLPREITVLNDVPPLRRAKNSDVAFAAELMFGPTPPKCNFPDGFYIYTKNHGCDLQPLVLWEDVCGKKHYSGVKKLASLVKLAQYLEIKRLL